MAVDVLVTGAAGVLGRQIVGNLRSSGYSVVATGRAPAHGLDGIWDVSCQDGPEPEYHPAIVVHAAARIQGYQQALENADGLFDVNVTGTFRVARWCVSHQVKRLVITSSAIVYGEWSEFPKTEEASLNPCVAGPYAVSKQCAEVAASLVNPSGVDLTVLRLSSLYGEGYENGLVQRFLATGRDSGNISLRPPVDDAFDLLHVADAAETVFRALAFPDPGIWNVGGGGLVTIRELAESSANCAGAELTIADESPDRLRRILNWVDDSKARNQLGHANRVSITDGIRQIAAGVGALGSLTSPG